MKIHLWGDFFPSLILHFDFGAVVVSTKTTKRKKPWKTHHLRREYNFYLACDRVRRDWGGCRRREGNLGPVSVLGHAPYTWNFNFFHPFLLRDALRIGLSLFPPSLSFVIRLVFIVGKALPWRTMKTHNKLAVSDKVIDLKIARGILSGLMNMYLCLLFFFCRLKQRKWCFNPCYCVERCERCARNLIKYRHTRYLG